MNIYDETKTIKLNQKDLNYEQGYLKDDKLIIHHNKIDGKREKGHYETIKEYPNGGKDVKWVIDEEGIEYQDAYDEEIDIQVFVKFDEKTKKRNLALNKIMQLKDELSQSDYKALKYFEGYYTEQEYQPIKEYRESLRNQIRQLEKELNN